MKALNNPFAGIEGYRCFGCSPENPAGLKMKFFEEGEEVVCLWTPDARYQGWRDVLHGGIQATLMDELASWVVFTKVRRFGFTSKLEIRYRRGIAISENPELVVRARLEEMRRNIAVIHVRLLDAENRICSEATAHYFTYTEDQLAAHFGHDMDGIAF